MQASETLGTQVSRGPRDLGNLQILRALKFQDLRLWKEDKNLTQSKNIKRVVWFLFGALFASIPYRFLVT